MDSIARTGQDNDVARLVVRIPSLPLPRRASRAAREGVRRAGRDLRGRRSGRRRSQGGTARRVRRACWCATSANRDFGKSMIAPLARTRIFALRASPPTTSERLSQIAGSPAQFSRRPSRASRLLERRCLLSAWSGSRRLAMATTRKRRADVEEAVPVEGLKAALWVCHARRRLDLTPAVRRGQDRRGGGIRHATRQFGRRHRVAGERVGSLRRRPRRAALGAARCVMLALS